MKHAITLAAVVSMMSTTVVAAESIEGRWITESGNLEVEIAPCRDSASALCGTVVRVIANRSMSGDTPMQPVDTRPALGMTILSSLVTAADDADHWTGDLYNRENGKTYRCTLSPDAPDRLKVRGYVGLPLFGKTQIWTRAAPVGAATPSGPTAPEFVGIDQWLNSSPLTLEQLRGRVVLVDFWTYMCGNCLATLPYVKQWHERYARDGLVVVGVHTPELPAERDPRNVQKAIARYEIEYPVALDTDYSTWKAYSNHYWPALYLIDRQGQVVYRHVGEGSYAETEARIRTLLADAVPNH